MVIRVLWYYGLMFWHQLQPGKKVLLIGNWRLLALQWYTALISIPGSFWNDIFYICHWSFRAFWFTGNFQIKPSSFSYLDILDQSTRTTLAKFSFLCTGHSLWARKGMESCHLHFRTPTRPSHSCYQTVATMMSSRNICGCCCSVK